MRFVETLGGNKRVSHMGKMLIAGAQKEAVDKYSGLLPLSVYGTVIGF